MKPVPRNWSRISSTVYYRDSVKAVDWLCSAFGFEVRLKIEGDDGRIEHSELTFGDGIIGVGDEAAAAIKGMTHSKSPLSVAGANTQNIMIYVDDAAAHCERARKAGAKIISEPTVSDHGDDYWSDRCFECEDFEGHRWWFCERIRDAK